MSLNHLKNMSMDSLLELVNFARLKLTVKIFMQTTLRKLRCSFKNNAVTVKQDGFALRNVTIIGRSDNLWCNAQLTSHSLKKFRPTSHVPGRGNDHPTPSSAEVKERVQLYLYSPFGPSWTVLGRTLPFNLPSHHKYRTN